MFNGRSFYCPRGRVRGQIGYSNYQHYNNYQNDDYINQIEIIMTKKKYTDDVENINFGTEYEDCICTKTSINLKAKSINERKVFTREYRIFHGIKILIVEGIRNKVYNSKLLKNGKFRVIPFSNNFFKIGLKYYDNYFISYNNQGVIIETNDITLKKKITEKDFSGDGYIGKYQIYKKGKKSNLYLLLYVAKCQIDGLFDIIKETKFSDFQADQIFSNHNQESIQEDSVMVFEIKSGDQPKKLIRQMKNRCYYIYQYLKTIYNKPIYYIGFYKEKDSSLIQSIDISNELKDLQELPFRREEDSDKVMNNSKTETEIINENQIKEEEIKIPENKEIKSANHEEILLANIIRNEQENSNSITDANTQNSKNGTEEMNQDKKNDKSIDDKYLQNKSDENINYVFNNYFADVYVNITILKLTDKIFGEEIKYDKEELNLLGELKGDVKDIKKKW